MSLRNHRNTCIKDLQLHPYRRHSWTPRPFLPPTAMFPICLASNAALARRGDGIVAAVMGPCRIFESRLPDADCIEVRF
jgi:hypothetical protein